MIRAKEPCYEFDSAQIVTVFFLAAVAPSMRDYDKLQLVPGRQKIYFNR
jgi:hypothetical protein